MHVLKMVNHQNEGLEGESAAMATEVLVLNIFGTLASTKKKKASHLLMDRKTHKRFKRTLF